jgi:hypothetical protein
VVAVRVLDRRREGLLPPGSQQVPRSRGLRIVPTAAAATTTTTTTTSAGLFVGLEDEEGKDAAKEGKLAPTEVGDEALHIGNAHQAENLSSECQHFFRQAYGLVKGNGVPHQGEQEDQKSVICAELLGQRRS